MKGEISDDTDRTSQNDIGFCFAQIVGFSVGFSSLFSRLSPPLLLE